MKLLFYVEGNMFRSMALRQSIKTKNCNRIIWKGLHCNLRFLLVIAQYDFLSDLPAQLLAQLQDRKLPLWHTDKELSGAVCYSKPYLRPHLGPKNSHQGFRPIAIGPITIPHYTYCSTMIYVRSMEVLVWHFKVIIRNIIDMKIMTWKLSMATHVGIKTYHSAIFIKDWWIEGFSSLYCICALYWRPN